MKKSAVRAILGFFVGVVLTFIVQLFIFKVDIQSIGKEAISSVFTGCLFAIFSALLPLLQTFRKTSNKEYQILYNLKETSQELIEKLNKDEISPEAAEMYEKRIKIYHKELNHIATHCCFFSKQHKSCLNIIQDATFEAVSNIREMKPFLRCERTDVIFINKRVQKKSDLGYQLKRCIISTNKLLR